MLEIGRTKSRVSRKECNLKEYHRLRASYTLSTHQRLDHIELDVLTSHHSRRMS